MKVICVKPIDNPSPSAMNKPRPKVGDIDTVVDEVKYDSIVYYELGRFGYDMLYASNCFSTLSTDLDETALVTEEFEEKYCVPVNQ
jgi:hypothetical protein